MLLERLNPVHWEWMIFLEMFLAGTAAGAYTIAAILEALGRGRSATARAAHLLAFPLLSVVTLLLIVDLNRPERFWHMALLSEQLLPAFKPWSPMSSGTILVIVFTLFAFVSFVDALIDAGLFGLGGWRATRTLHGSLFGLIWSVAGSLIGLSVAIYAGVLLSVTNLPGWGHSPFIPAVYGATAMLTGLAALVLIQTFRRQPQAELPDLVRANILLTGWWLLIVLAFIASLLLTIGNAARYFFVGPWGLAIVASVLLAGVIPLVLLLRPTRRPRSLVLSAVLILIGGLLLRAGILMGPQEWLH